MTTEEIKLQIIENYIDWFTSDEVERNQMKGGAKIYVDEDHVDEIGQSGLMRPTTIKRNGEILTLELVVGNEDHAAFFNKDGSKAFVISEVENELTYPLYAKDINTGLVVEFNHKK